MTDQTAGKGPPSTLTLVFSFLTHTFLAVMVFSIAIRAMIVYSFFSWHPFCMSIGVFLIFEAVYCISGESFLGPRLSRKNRVRMHWILHTVGLYFIIAGFIFILANKYFNNKSHFSTPHSILGLISIILILMVAGFGVVTNKSKWLYPKVRPVLLKILHALGGISVVILLLATIITGYYTHWWMGADAVKGVGVAATVCACFFIVLKPILGVTSRSMVVFRPPSSNS